VIVQLHAALLDQLKQADGCDRLGHREETEDGVVGDRRAALHIGLALHISVHLLAMTEDGHDNARHLSLIDVAVGQIGDPMKATAIESELLRCHCHKS
jgi:hypothetical protein